MLSLTRPGRTQIERWLERQAGAPFSYAEVGATADESRLAALPGGCALDRDRARLGSGRGDYARAVAALRRWQMFALGWVELCWPTAPIAEGSTVGVLMHAGVLWSLNACRIVQLVGESGPVERFGFAYGTLRDHALCGEERFRVEWRREDDSVWYDLLRFSRPGGALARATRPLVRRLQRRFARDSLRAMQAATRA